MNEGISNKRKPKLDFSGTKRLRRRHRRGQQSFIEWYGRINSGNHRRFPKPRVYVRYLPNKRITQTHRTYPTVTTDFDQIRIFLAAQKRERKRGR